MILDSHFLAQQVSTPQTRARALGGVSNSNDEFAVNYRVKGLASCKWFVGGATLKWLHLQTKGDPTARCAATPQERLSYYLLTLLAIFYYVNVSCVLALGQLVHIVNQLC